MNNPRNKLNSPLINIIGIIIAVVLFAAAIRGIVEFINDFLGH